jgi:benzodiazapine receptor
MARQMARQTVNAVAVAITIVFNILANALPLNGLNTGEISDRFAVYFVPAGYVFSIWGLIYVGWIAFAVYQALPAQRENPRLVRLGYWFALSCVANIGWLISWHYEYFIAGPFILAALAILLIVAYLRLEIGRTRVSTAERWCVQIPFSVYLAWATVATIANVTSTLYFVGWSGLGIAPEVWAAVMLVVATIVGVLVYRDRRDVAFQLVLVWAFVGIATKHAGVPVVAVTAWLTSLVLLGMIVVGAISRRQRKA